MRFHKSFSLLVFVVLTRSDAFNLKGGSELDAPEGSKKSDEPKKKPNNNDGTSNVPKGPTSDGAHGIEPDAAVCSNPEGIQGTAFKLLNEMMGLQHTMMSVVDHMIGHAYGATNQCLFSSKEGAKTEIGNLKELLNQLVTTDNFGWVSGSKEMLGIAEEMEKQIGSSAEDVNQDKHPTEVVPSTNQNEQDSEVCGNIETAQVQVNEIVQQIFIFNHFMMSRAEKVMQHTFAAAQKCRSSSKGAQLDVEVVKTIFGETLTDEIGFKKYIEGIRTHAIALEKQIDSAGEDASPKNVQDEIVDDQKNTGEKLSKKMRNHDEEEALFIDEDIEEDIKIAEALSNAGLNPEMVEKVLIKLKDIDV